MGGPDVKVYRESEEGMMMQTLSLQLKKVVFKKYKINSQMVLYLGSTWRQVLVSSHASLSVQLRITAAFLTKKPRHSLMASNAITQCLKEAGGTTLQHTMLDSVVWKQMTLGAYQCN